MLKGSLTSSGTGSPKNTNGSWVKENNLQEANKEIIRKYFKAIDEEGKIANAEILDEFLSEDFIEHNPPPGIPGNRDGWKQLFKMFSEATPGYHVIDDLIAEDDKVPEFYLKNDIPWHWRSCDVTFISGLNWLLQN